MHTSREWDFDTYNWVEEYDARMRRWERLCYEETLRRLPECAGARVGERVLDIGTGTGNSAVPFLERGCSVVGLDPSSRMLRQAEAKVVRWAGRFVIRQVDDPFATLPFAGQTFDVVVTAYAIHHLDDEPMRQAVREMKRVLAPGGRIIVADTMFRDAAHKARCLAEDGSLEDEFQPLLDSFPGLFHAVGLETELYSMGPLVWALVARHSEG